MGYTSSVMPEAQCHKVKPRRAQYLVPKLRKQQDICVIMAFDELMRIGDTGE
jgi:hypothetical protein